MIKKLVLIINILLVHATTGISQTLKFEDATKLSSSINSDVEESMPLFSGDGSTMYFIRSFHKENKGGKFAGPDIWRSQKDDSVWSKATNQLGVFNNKKNNAVIGLRSDNRTIYLLDSYGGTVHGIAFSRLINNKWTKPEKIPIKGLNRDGFMGFYMNPSYDVLLISMKEQSSYGEEDLYISLKDKFNKWSVPRNLGATINSAGFEISPFLSSDKKYLFFSSNGHPGFGNADIFVSERLYNSWDVWSVPKNLGPVINSKSFDAYFTLTADSIVYFSSNRETEHANIYQSYVIIDNTDESQERIDRLIKEANAILVELQNIRGRNTEELILLYEYNKFSIGEEDKLKMEDIIDKTKDKDRFMIQLNSFSFEDYSDPAKRLIISKREQSVREFFIEKGISSVNIISESSSNKVFIKFSNDNIGGVKVKISY